MQCREVEGVLEQEGLAPLPEAARVHVAGCSSCQSLLADLDSIVCTAREIPAEIEPPARVWISLRAQLQAEGLIKESVPAAQSVSWWHGLSDLFRSRAMATAAVGLVIVAAAVFQLQPGDVRNSQAPLLQESADSSQEPFRATRTTLNDQEPVAKGMILASTSEVDASLRQNLETLDQFIADCERRLKEEPQDEVAREYLAAAYQQKAELLSAMMDRGGGVN
jgi:hypothetical protein